MALRIAEPAAAAMAAAAAIVVIVVAAARAPASATIVVFVVITAARTTAVTHEAATIVAVTIVAIHVGISRHRVLHQVAEVEVERNGAGGFQACSAPLQFLLALGEFRSERWAVDLMLFGLGEDAFAALLLLGDMMLDHLGEQLDLGIEVRIV